jgi:hypothetical protein
LTASDSRLGALYVITKADRFIMTARVERDVRWLVVETNDK